MGKDRVHLPGHQSANDRGRGRDTAPASSAFQAPANPVPLAVMRTAGRPSTAADDVHPLARLRREPGGVIRRGGGKNGGTATVPKKKTPQEIANEKKPQPGQTYTLDQARAELKKYDHNVSSMPFRKQIAEAWGEHIFANFAQLKAGVIRDTYKSSFDKGHDDEFSVSQEIDGIPEIVIHAHMDKDGKPKPGNGVHWKWADGEKVSESYEMSATLVARLLEATAAKKEWDTNGKKKYVTVPTTASPGTPGSAGTAGTGGTTSGGGTVTPTATVSLPTTPKT